MNEQEKIREIGAVASIITENMFEAVHMSVKPQEGVIGAYYRVSELAQEFVYSHSHITDWDQYADKVGCSDFEEVVLKYTSEAIKEKYCSIRKDLIEKQYKIPYGENGNFIQGNGRFQYKWEGDNAFFIYVPGFGFQSANSIDFEFN